MSFFLRDRQKPQPRTRAQSDRGFSAQSDRGFSLPEVLVSIALMGSVIIIVLNGMSAVIAASATSDDQAKVEAVLTSAADRLSGWAYQGCPETNLETGYQAVASAAAADVKWNPDRVTVLTPIEYWDPSAQDAATAPRNADGDLIASNGSWSTTNTLSASQCSTAVTLSTAKTLQRITIQVSSPDDKIVRRIQVVKSNVGELIDEGATATPPAATP